MKQLLFSTAAALALTASVQAQDASAIQSAIDEGVARLNEEGANVSFGERTVGADDSVTLRDVRMAPEGDSLVIEAEFITLTPSPDTPGDVTITVSDVITLRGGPDDGAPPIDFAINSTGLALTTNWILAPEGKPRGELVAETLNVTGGDEDHPILRRLLIGQEDVEGSLALDLEARDMAAALSASSLAMDYVIGDPIQGSTTTNSSRSEGFEMTFAGSGFTNSDEIEAFLADGSFDLEMTAGPGTGSFLSDSPDMPVSMTGSSDDPAFTRITMEEGDFEMVAGYGKLAYTVATDPSVLPLPPFDVNLGSMAFEFAMPLSPGEDVREARMVFDLKELEVGESAWSLIDPGQSIPRDPATLELALSADVVLDTPLSEAGETASPLELGRAENATIDRLLLSIGGAQLEGNGAVELDNSGPIPVPNGAIELSLSGAQTLGNTLAELGLVDPLQVGMMMGMIMAFAEPGDAPDSFSSTIEFRDGSILANGQPIQ